MQHLPDEGVPEILPALRWAWVILMLLDEPVVPSAPLMSSGMPLRANQRLSLARLNATIRNAICMRPFIFGGANTLGLSVTCGRYGLVQLGGLEPPTSCSTDRRSNQLSYNCIARRPQKRGREWAGN